MKAGQTNINVGTKVRVISNDPDVNGIEGVVTHPFAFGCTKENWVGIWVSPQFQEKCVYVENFNVKISEIKSI